MTGRAAGDGVTWDDPFDPTMREWRNVDPRFRQLLVEKELGDFLLCVATKTRSSTTVVADLRYELQR